MIVKLSPAVYVALCGLVQDALEYPSDATHILKRAGQELSSAVASDNMIELKQPDEIETPRRVASVG